MAFKKIFGSIFLLLLITSFTSASWHKFYVSVTQMEYVPKKKAIEITSRIFIDDLDLALEKRFKKKIYLGTSRESSDSKELLQVYFSENFLIKINNQQKAVNFLGKEVEENVMICYVNIKEVEKINSIEIKNTILMELFEQQHIIHLNVLGEKQSILLTNSKTSAVLK